MSYFETFGLSWVKRQNILKPDSREKPESGFSTAQSNRCLSAMLCTADKHVAVNGPILNKDRPDEPAQNLYRMMTELLVTLFVIALLDSTSMILIGVVPLAAILGEKRPVFSAVGFLAGIFFVYAVTGLLLMFGLDAVIDVLRPVILRWWNQPNTPELVLQLVVGLAMLVVAWKQRNSPSQDVDPRAPPTLSPAEAFTLGFSLTIVGIPGAVPYFGAIEQILRADLTTPASIGAILFYSLAFLTPFLLLVLVRVLVPAHSERIFQATASIIKRWGKHLVVGALCLLGIILIADGVGWFLGSPLLPVDPTYSTEPGRQITEFDGIRTTALW